MNSRQEKERRESPETPSLAYEDMLPSWSKVQSVLDGTDALRKAGQTYLPQHDNETDHAYRERLGKNTLLNITKLTLESWVGRPFSDPIRFEEDAPAPIDSYFEDIDLQGNNLDTFCRAWFSDGLAKAFSHVFVEFPRVDNPEDRPRSLADDSEEGVRPYWVHIRPEDLFFADAVIENGREILREIRIMETVTERDGFAEKHIEQIRRVYITDVVDPDSGESQRKTLVELYRLADTRKKKRVWVVVEDYTMDIDVIPLATFYAHRDGVMHGVPPLKDLADLNIAHWQSTSDQRAILTVSRFPMLAVSGGTGEDDEGEPITVGPHRVWHITDPQGKIYYVEPKGTAIESGLTDLESLETQMAEYGAAFLKKNPGNPTATARALDSAEATSSLQDVTRRFADTVNQALAFTAMWVDKEEGGVVELTTDFGPEEVTQPELAALDKARTIGDISRDAYLNELKRRGILDEEYDIEKDGLKVESEGMEGIPGSTPQPDPTAPGEEEADDDDDADDDAA